MDRPKNLILALSVILTLSLFVLLARCPKAECGQDGGDLPDQNDVDSIVIALTRLDVNDLILDVNDQTTDANDQSLDPNDETLNIDEPTLELRWKIKNNSDQDIWICDSVGFIEDEFEVYMEDDQTLLIRKRLDVPTMILYYIDPTGQYSRLRAGEERVKSLSINMPVHHHWIFIPRLEKQGVMYARRLVVEIGYHTKDLPRMVELSEQRYPDPNTVEKVIMSWLDSANEGEHALQITVDGVLIPYEDVPVDYVP